MRIKERCSCGAEVEVEAASSLAENHVTKWRANHQHVARPYGYPYVTYGGGAVYAQTTSAARSAATQGAVAHSCDEGDDGKCETCGRDMDGYE